MSSPFFIGAVVRATHTSFRLVSRFKDPRARLHPSQVQRNGEGGLKITVNSAHLLISSPRTEGPLSILDELAWEYKSMWPAYLVIDRLAMFKINKLFSFLLKIQVIFSKQHRRGGALCSHSNPQVAQLALSRSWSMLKSNARRHRQLNFLSVILCATLLAPEIPRQNRSNQHHD